MTAFGENQVELTFPKYPAHAGVGPLIPPPPLIVKLQTILMGEGAVRRTVSYLELNTDQHVNKHVMAIT